MADPSPGRHLLLLAATDLMAFWAALSFALLLTACPQTDDDDSSAITDPSDDDDSVLPDDDDDDTTLQPTWSSIHPLLLFRCSCHRTNEGGDGGLTGMEDPDSAYANLVDQASEDVPSMDLIEPGDPERSYALFKILNLQASVGGRGRRMPLTGTALREDQVDVLRAWILAGAQQE